MLPLLAALAFQDPAQTFSGRERQLQVTIPRSESHAVVDGILDEPAWQTAARLTGFSQYQPVDGQAAEEPTEVRVWYAPDAIWFGIKAREIHGDVVRATRANRDNISSEDQVQILLDTYNDRRLAFLFGVNALGVQQDGTRSDQFGGGAGGRSAQGGGVGNINPLDGTVDLNPDFAFESRGRLVDGGYEVEIRIPFKSLRYGEGAQQTWGINVLRRVQHSGFQDSWAPAVRASASFLGQSGTLTGLHDLQRGLVLEMTPTFTQRVDGGDVNGDWNYNGWSELGGDARWGITQNMSLNATFRPDFSQVEADVGQVVLNERFALFYPEKRPFFLDGLELFDTPNQLIYTRRITDPDAGFKLAGKTHGTNIGTLFAVDNSAQSATGNDHPLFGIARMRHDFGRNGTFGLVGTTREDGDDHSRLVGADARFYHSRLYFVEVQAVQSWSRSSGTDTSGPLFQVQWDRTGRAWGFNYAVRAIAPGFEAAAGFVNRTNVIDVHAFNRLTGYGKPGAFVQTYGSFFTITRIWDYASPAGGPIEGSDGINPSATLRGGWNVGGTANRQFFTYSPGDYATFSTTGGPFVVPGPERNLFSGSLRLTTPTWRLVTVSGSVGYGRTAIFREGARGTSKTWTLTADLRPTSNLRVSAQANGRTIERVRDGSQFSDELIPRIKVEYQLTRAIFMRFVGQITDRDLDSLVDRNGVPILVNGTITSPSHTKEFRMDWLFSYRPTPGTLVYVGYGSTFDDLAAPYTVRRAADGFFGKVSWLFRL